MTWHDTIDFEEIRSGESYATLCIDRGDLKIRKEIAGCFHKHNDSKLVYRCAKWYFFLKGTEDNQKKVNVLCIDNVSAAPQAKKKHNIFKKSVSPQSVACTLDSVVKHHLLFCPPPQTLLCYAPHLPLSQRELYWSVLMAWCGSVCSV
uniref:Uncharacterized protein n=1 Tax=Micrurus corallinus TaxID=54390 RepID=A0A2D4EYA6_MICCO